jgi:RHS repeat-associated protein
MVLHVPVDQERCHAGARLLLRRPRAGVLLLWALILASAATVSAGTFTAFGPRTYQRSAGRPVTERATFSVLNPSTQYTLRIHVKGVASAVVSINGVDVVGPSDFNATITLIEKPVVLQTSNDLAVEVRGEPGGMLSVEIIGIDNEPPVITAIRTPEPNTNGWNNADVTVTFTCTDATSGVAFCQVPITVSAEGRDQVVTGEAADRAGNSASVSVTLNIDRTPPVFALTSPPDGAVVTTSPITVKGSVTDMLSGVAVATCNGVSATVVATELTCVVTLTPGPNQITVSVTDLAGNSKSSIFSVTFQPTQEPTISDFNPKVAAIGTLINVTGSGFVPTPGAVPRITVARQGGGAIDAPVSSFGNDRLIFVIPAGATTGNVTVTVAGKSSSSSAELTITPSSSFNVAASPGIGAVIQGQSTAYAASVASGDGFSGVVSLAVSGLPSGLSADFYPPRISVGQTAVLTINAPADQAPSSSTLMITASTTVDGILLTRSASVGLNVEAATTSLIGRTVVADNLQTPIAGVTVKMLGKNGNGGTTTCSAATVSDAAGNFALTDLGPECVGPQLVGYDGLSATSPEGKYAGVNLVYTLQANRVTASPVLVHLPRIDDKETFFVRQNSSEDQSYSYRSIPGLTVTVYGGTTFTLEDGSRPDPFPLVAVQVPVDRLPDAKPPVPTMVSAFIVAFQPANAVASQPAAVFYPNTLNTPPGTNMTLMTLDPTRGRMVPYGTATVSSGGSQIVPDLDPEMPGHRYGIVNFDWHGPMPPPPPPPTPDSPNPDDPSPDQCVPGVCCEPPPMCGANPVDLSSGLETIVHTDISIGSARGSISLQRYFRTLSMFAGPFGIGTHHNYGYRLDTINFQDADLINLVMPDGNRFPFTKALILAPPEMPPPAPNELRNYTIPALLGTVMTVLPGEVQVRWKDGTIYRFRQPNPQFTPQLESIIDSNGNAITIARNPNNPNQVTQITDPTGRSLQLTYDGANRITSVRDPLGRVVAYAYNAQGTLETVTDPEGAVTTYEYDELNRPIKETDARGIVVAQTTYHATGRVATQTQADGGIFTFDYALANPIIPSSPILATTVTDPLGRKTIHRFTPVGFLTDTTLANGQLVAVDRDVLTNQVLVRKPIGTDVGQESFEYDERGNLLKYIDALGNATTYTYDAVVNKVTSITDALGSTTDFSYDTRGNLLSQTDPDGKPTTYRYDTNGLLTEATDPLGQKTRSEYDTFGTLVKVTDPLRQTTQFRYDGLSRLIEIMDSLGRKTLTEYDKLSRVIRETDAKGQTTHFSFDPVGNLLSVTDARDKTTAFSYDVMNRLRTRTDPLRKIDTRLYDSNGNMLSFTDRRGQTNTFTYDDMDQLKLEQYADGSRVERSYDALGRLVQANDSSGVFGFQYDLAGGLLRSIGPTGTIQYQRDRLGRVTSRQVVGQPAVTYGYNATGSLSGAAMSGASVSFRYDARNQPTTVSRSNGVTTSYTYDPAGRVISIVHARGVTTLRSLDYSYDSAGNRISQQASSGQSLVTQQLTATYDESNRLIQRDNMSFLYDDNGNLVAEIAPGGTTTYAWDSRNRLSTIATPEGQATEFTYDARGHLIRQTDSGPLGTVARSFVVDSLTNVAYQQSSDGDQFSVLTGQTIDSHLAAVRSNGEAEFGLSDVINSTVNTTDQSGILKGQFFYEPYGETRANGSNYPFQYTGRVPVSGGLYYYRARFYSPAIGRFISEDPLELAADLQSEYVYAKNNPINLLDPTGLKVDPECVFACLFRKTVYSNPGDQQRLLGCMSDILTGTPLSVNCLVITAKYFLDIVGCTIECNRPDDDGGGSQLPEPLRPNPPRFCPIPGPIRPMAGQRGLL